MTEFEKLKRAVYETQMKQIDLERWLIRTWGFVLVLIIAVAFLAFG